MRTQIGREAQQIGEHAAGRDLGSRARTLNDERIVAIAAGREAHHVVGERDVRERMFRVQARQPHGRVAVRVDPPDVAQHLSRFRLPEASRHAGIELRKPLHELLHAAAVERLRNQALTCTSDISSVRPISRPRMISLRATSMPDKSSRGSGSV